MSEPVAWIPVGVQWPFEDLDILFSDGSVLMSVIPQADGDFWWRGGGAGERFFDPVHSEVTHWRPHVDSSTADATELANAIDALMAERDALAREVDACAAALPGPYYMDPPDGGDVSISEQLRRMARDAARYRWLRQPNPLHREAHIAVLTHNGGWVASEEKADAAIDAAMKGASDD